MASAHKGQNFTFASESTPFFYLLYARRASPGGRTDARSANRTQRWIRDRASVLECAQPSAAVYETQQLTTLQVAQLTPLNWHRGLLAQAAQPPQFCIFALIIARNTAHGIRLSPPNPDANNCRARCAERPEFNARSDFGLRISIRVNPCPSVVHLGPQISRSAAHCAKMTHIGSQN
jgi:hypothetical protein